MNNKKIKVISSMAVAGLLTLNVFSANALVAQAKEVDDTVNATRPLGVYRSLISGENTAVAPVVVQKDKTTLADDYVTVNELVNSDKISNITAFNGKSINSVSRKEMVKTGDTITIAGGETVTVVVYGDVNKDGLVDGDDASEILKYDVNHEGAPLDSIQKLAADVKNSGSNKGIVDGDDASHILKYEVGLPDIKAIEVEPTAEEVKYNYTLSVEGGYINNQNAGTGKTVTVNIGLTPSNEDIKGLKLKVLDSEGVDLTSKVSAPSSVTINKNKNLEQVSGLDFTTEDSTTHTANTPDGMYTIQLLDKDDKVVGETTVEKNTVTPTVAKVVAKRVNTKDATVSLEGYGTELKKVYYEVNTTAGFDADSIDDETKCLEVRGNKLVDAPLNQELANNNSYIFEYVLENIYGSRSTVLSATIAKDSDSVKEEPAVANTITVPTLIDGDDKFSWTPNANMTAGAKYTVTLYKDGKIIDEDNDVSDTNKDYTLKMEEPGKYKIGVVVNGASDGTTTASEEVMSGEVEVKQLKEVSKIEFTIPETGTERKLSWTDANATQDVGGYIVKIYEYDVTNKKYDTTNPVATETITNPDTKEIDISSISGFTYKTNTMYQAEVVVDAKATQKAIVSSDKKLSEGFYEVTVTGVNVTNATDASVTIEGVTGTVSGFIPTYKVEVYEAVTETEGLIQAISKYKYLTTKDVTVTNDGKIVVNGLEQNKNYGFKLVANVNGITGKSAPIYGATLPKIENLKKVDTVNDAKVKGTIYSTNSDKANAEVYIDGKATPIYSTGTTLLYPAYSSLVDALAIVEKIHTNDIITISDDTITVSLEGSKASGTNDTIDFGDTAVGKNLVLTGKARTQRTVKATADTTTGAKPVEVKLQGIDAMFKTDDLVADKIILTNGVEVIEANTKEFVIAANSTVTINGVKVKTDKETTIEANGTTLKVKLEEGTVNNNNLTFTSKEKKAVIGFVAITNGNPATYIGTITIDSDGGSVEVNTVSSVNVKDTKLNITAKNAKVDISGADQANNSSITTTLTDEFVQGNADKTLTFVAKKDIPAQITTAIANGSVDLKDYTDTELKSVFGNTLTAKQMEEIREFIDSFNLNGKGANIKAINGKVVTIDFTKAGTFTVEGIK